jgi:Zn-dependent protease/predicted transcriptional regulator
MRSQASPGFRLGHVRGIEIRIDWSLAFIFFLIVLNLGAGLFPRQHPEWPALLSWAVAVVAAVLFFASVLTHELAHALMAQRQGVPVQEITLFIFGGLARIGGEPANARQEFLIAIVGPLTSVAIGIVATALGLLSANVPAAAMDQPEALVSRLSPLSSLLLWLGPINILLAVFNLIPGFPLDGGRVLRAILWRATGDVVKATRWASIAGRVVALGLIFLGTLMLFGQRVPFFGQGVVSGLWLILIGWFLLNAALVSHQHVVVRESLKGIPVARLMRQDAVSVPPAATLDEAANRFLETRDQQCLPVVEGGRLLGMVCTTDLGAVPREEWSQRRVEEVMARADEIPVAQPNDQLSDALTKLTTRDIDQLPVVEGGRLQGFLRRGDVLRWLQLRAA